MAIEAYSQIYRFNLLPFDSEFSQMVELAFTRPDAVKRVEECLRGLNYRWF
jgi:hypothetical protein